MEGYPDHGGNLEWAAERYGLQPGDFLDFSNNVNPLGPPLMALEAAREALLDVSRYPEPDAHSLKSELSEYLGISGELIMFGNGSTELIYHICRCIKPGRVSIVAPVFGEYEKAARAAGSEVFNMHLSPEDGFSLDPDDLVEAAAGSDMVFVCNPASPTGRLYDFKEIYPALRTCRERGRVMVVDESFMGFCPPSEKERATLLSEVQGGGLVIISTLTKLFALAGLRGPGYLVAGAEQVREWEQAAVPWRVNLAAAAAGRAALADGEYIRRTIELVTAWREDLAAQLYRMALFDVYPSQANFLLLRLRDDRFDSASLADALGWRGILVRNCSNFRGLDSTFLRVAVRKPTDNAKLIGAFAEIFAV